MKKTLLIVIILIILTSCGQSSKNAVVECKGNFVSNTDQRTMDVVQILEYEKDTNKILKQTVKNTISNPDKESANVLKDRAEEIKAEYTEFGYDYIYTIKDTVFEETTIIDYTKLDIKDLVDKGALEKVQGQYPEYIDLEKTLDELKARNFTCTKK